jgi:hypothetical protein
MRRRWPKIALLLALACCFCAVAIAQTPPKSSGPFDGCAVEGVGGDPDLNTQKNRSVEPDAVSKITVAQMRKLPKVPRSDGKDRSAWPNSLADRIEAQEKQTVFFIGYVIHAKAEGKESSNCQLTAAKDHDVHVYVGDGPDDDASSSAIVEVTPRWRNTNPTWNAAEIQQLVTSGAQVRITGFLLYDQEHWDMISKGQRSTLWEIHPITNIEVQTKSGWMELSSYVGATGGQGLLAQNSAAAPHLINVRTPAQTQAAARGADQLP